ncbi:hypothetical protein C8P64_0074 [Christiangramia gaetbulicola]|uniref:Uncharacterized protein n=1 Tax=Christiangramia gaetbulicola TaxID=703340 RepID=A0A2T6AJW8_9FLAO|nr:hypothetical protein [Christiangramia gaetbulicola]PTX44104.1 hypothetical protein C8P64_0074 [Christiangramia gaetbulicola]
MIELDQETWIYLTIIAVFLAYFLWSSRRAKNIKKQRKNRNFRKRYMERKKENESDSLVK